MLKRCCDCDNDAAMQNAKDVQSFHMELCALIEF